MSRENGGNVNSWIALALHGYLDLYILLFLTCISHYVRFYHFLLAGLLIVIAFIANQIVSDQCY